MGAIRRHLAGTERAQQLLAETVGARRLQAVESLSAPIWDRQTRQLKTEMEGARSLQAGTKEAELFKAVREGVRRLQAGRRKLCGSRHRRREFDGSTGWGGARVLYSRSIGGSSEAQGLDGDGESWAAPGRDCESSGGTPGTDGRSSSAPGWAGELRSSRVRFRKLVKSRLGQREHDGSRLQSMTQF